MKVGQIDDALILTLNDPKRRNPITPELADEMASAISNAEADEYTRAIVLTGADGTFCSGGDLRNMPPPSEADAEDRLDRYANLVRTITLSTRPVIAAIEGVAAGIGVGIASHCDFIVAAADVRFLIPFSKLGLFPDGGLIHGLSHRVGVAKARALLMLGEPIPATYAHRLGLVDEIARTGEALADALTIAARLAKRSPSSIEHIKRAFSRDVLDIETALGLERDSQTNLYFTDDFLQRRDRFFSRP